MKRAFLTGAVAAGVFAAVVALLASWQAAGLLDDSVMELSGKALMFAEARAGIGDFGVAYPPLPLLFTFAFAYIAPSGPLPAVLATGLLTAILAAVLFSGFAERKYSLLLAAVATLFVIGNPLTLHALSYGPGAPLMLITAYMLGQGIFGLGTRGTVSDLMLTGVALLLLAFSHPAGMILAAASVPCLIFVAPRPYMECAPVNLLILIFFPLIFALVAFGYVRWVFGSPAFAFFDSVTVAAVDANNMTDTWRAAAKAALSVFVAAPLIAAFAFRTKGQVYRAVPAVAVGATVLAAALLQIALGGGGGDKMLIIAAAPIMAAVCATNTFRSRVNEILIGLLLSTGVAGASVAFAVNAAPSPTMGTSSANTGQAELLQLSEILRAKSGVMIDTSHHAGFVAIRGTAAGLIMPGDPEFEVQHHTARLASPFVAVPRPGIAVEQLGRQYDESSQRQDRIVTTFPQLYEHGAQGYGLIYDEGGWRIYARNAADGRK